MKKIIFLMANLIVAGSLSAQTMVFNVQEIKAKDFSESDEGIASNILSARLKMLEEFKIITKDKLN